MFQFLLNRLTPRLQKKDTMFIRILEKCWLWYSGTWLLGTTTQVCRYPLLPPCGRRIRTPYQLDETLLHLRHDQIAANVNYRISRGRRIVENAFGILANRLRVILGRMQKSPEVVQIIVKCCVILHNMMRMRYPGKQPKGKTMTTISSQDIGARMPTCMRYVMWMPLTRTARLGSSSENTFGSTSTAPLAPCHGRAGWCLLECHLAASRLCPTSSLLPGSTFFLVSSMA
ncbi:hypothetical protein MAR_014123 [Mya arenaria]|uniref:DDE Tnp4 domain-containing protein n=1 Tax=Mya arenaria TaxID=6604 RepID=A0ABY7G4Y0_MYAAR|nr:hypothetical protein MAR_014123 [Mya arenaria]